MPTLQEIESQLGSLSGLQKKVIEREVKELPNILSNDEKLESVLRANFGSNSGILVATNKRILFVDKGFWGSLKVEDMFYDKINSIQYETGFAFGSVAIFISSIKLEFTKMEKQKVKDFAERIRVKISSISSAQIARESVSVSAGVDDIADKLEKLGSLLHKGLLTEEEFITQKKKLLES